MTRTVVRRAPGKLFVAGEYAVLHAGTPAILAAVDRGVEVTATASGDDIVIVSDLSPGETRLRRDWAGFVPGGGRSAVASAIEATDEFLACRGIKLPPLRLTITSGLHENGVKFGMGSSGAVIVATVAAVLAYCGVQLSAEDRFRLALVAAARFDPGASGGDVAASTWGGWISYQAPDREFVLDLAGRAGVAKAIRQRWPGFAVRRLPPPRGLSLEVGWTGKPASTAGLVARLAETGWHRSTAYREFVRLSGQSVRAAAQALEQRDNTVLLDQVRLLRKLLEEFDRDTRLGVFTEDLVALCDAAESENGAAKPSGAGGGDCGIALVPAGSAVPRLRERWAEAGISSLSARVVMDERTFANDS